MSNDYKFNPSTGEFEKPRNESGGFKRFLFIGYWIIALIMGFIWVPGHGFWGTVWGVIKSIFWGVIALFNILRWIWDLIF